MKISQDVRRRHGDALETDGTEAATARKSAVFSVAGNRVCLALAD